MQIQKMTFLKEDLAAVEEKERIFFIGTAHISNEINVLSKLFQWAISRPTSEIERRVMLTQGLMLGRLLNGKLYECWRFLEKAFFGAQVSKIYSPILSGDATEALKELKAYFSSNNVIATVRNEFSFHYDPTHFGTGYNALENDVLLEIYLAEQNANTIFSFADDIVGRGMIDAINSTDKSKAMDSFMTETSRISGLISVFLGSCMRLAIDRNLSHKKTGVDVITLSGLQNWSDIRIPYFTNVPSHFSFELKDGKKLTWGEHSVAAPKLFNS